MFTEESASLAIDIAKSFMQRLNGIEPKWEKGYLRYEYHDFVGEGKGTYVCKNKVEFIGLANEDFIRQLHTQAQKFLESLDKPQRLFLLIVNSNKEYEFKFENKNMNRWKISKMDGGTGIPEGEE
jgi:hypothetical protein